MNESGVNLPRILMDEVDCKGHENSIFECGFKDLSNCDHSEDVSLMCTGVSFDDYVSVYNKIAVLSQLMET